MKDNYDTVAEAVRRYWKESALSQNVVAFFSQKYEFEDEEDWEPCAVLIESNGSDDFENVGFEYDFCEGETCIKNLKIVPLWFVFDFYERLSKIAFNLASEYEQHIRIKGAERIG